MAFSSYIPTFTLTPLRVSLDGETEDGEMIEHHWCRSTQKDICSEAPAVRVDRLPGSEFWLYHFLSVWSEASHMTSLSLTSHTCKLGQKQKCLYMQMSSKKKKKQEKHSVQWLAYSNEHSVNNSIVTALQRIQNISNLKRENIVLKIALKKHLDRAWINGAYS